jgi:hypothetical protein
LSIRAFKISGSGEIFQVNHKNTEQNPLLILYEENTAGRQSRRHSALQHFYVNFWQILIFYPSEAHFL